jgi:hypothetical protein
MPTIIAPRPRSNGTPPGRGLDLTARGSTVGVRFDNVDVSYGAHVADTYLEITFAGRDAPLAELVIQAELSANASPLRLAPGRWLSHEPGGAGRLDS